MTTTTPPGAATAGLREPARPAYRVTALRVLHSEWGKFWSLRSSWITLGITLILLIAIGAIASAAYSPGATASSGPPGPGSGSPSNAVSLALLGSTFALLAIGVLGILVSAGEYTTGTIRSTLAAVPRRLPVLWSKSAVFAAIATPVATAGAIAAFLLGSLALHGDKIALSLGDGGVLRSLLGAGLYLGLAGVAGVALGMLIRSSAGAIAVLVGVLLIVPGLTQLLPKSWASDINRYLPSNAGQAMMSLHQSANSLSPWAGLAVLAGWVALALAGAAYRLVRTDA